MEIGSFIELQFPKNREYYSQNRNIARLNAGRTAIWHALRVLGCRIVWLPYYQCDTVRDFLRRKIVKIKFYHIDENFDPIDLLPEDNEAVVLVNYYGVMSADRMAALAKPYQNVIIDNSQAFFAKPIEGCMNVYSCRKFVGVPDGAYVLGKDAGRFVDGYDQCHSSDTALFLLQRIEYGCEGKAYASRSINERRIDTEDAMRMSRLTQTILDGTDYVEIKVRRRENFEYVSQRLAGINRLDPMRYYDGQCVPMVYPMVAEDEGLLNRLQEAKHFQGHWWSYLLDELPEDTFECWLSKFIVPITIDQRYGE